MAKVYIPGRGFGIPGPAGPQGPQGEQGEAGPPGADGSGVDPLSIRYYGSPGRGSTNTYVLRWSTKSDLGVGTDPMSQSATLGDAWVIPADGVYEFDLNIYNYSGAQTAIQIRFGANIDNLIDYDGAKQIGSIFIAHNDIKPLSKGGYFTAGTKVWATNL